MSSLGRLKLLRERICVKKSDRHWRTLLPVRNGYIVYFIFLLLFCYQILWFLIRSFKTLLRKPDCSYLAGDSRAYWPYPENTSFEIFISRNLKFRSLMTSIKLRDAENFNLIRLK